MPGIESLLPDLLATSPVVLGTLGGAAAAAIALGVGWFGARRRAAKAEAACAEARKMCSEIQDARTRAERLKINRGSCRF